MGAEIAWEHVSASLRQPDILWELLIDDCRTDCSSTINFPKTLALRTRIAPGVPLSVTPQRILNDRVEFNMRPLPCQ